MQMFHQNKFLPENQFADTSPKLSVAQDDCDWFKEMQTTQSFFSSYPGVYVWRGPTLHRSAVEGGLAMRLSPVQPVLLWKDS